MDGGAGMRKPILQLETINACNAKCTFCAMPSQKKRRKPITDSLFSKIIDDAKSYGITQIMPFLNGEPMLDEKLSARIKEINEKIPEAFVSFFSNGSLLSSEKIEELSKVNVAAVNFSINAITDKGRTAVMGMPLEATVANILAYQKKCPKVHITVSALMDTTLLTPDEMREFTRFWQEKRIKPNLFFNGNWAGKTRKTFNAEGCCERPSSMLTVLSNGSVALCCYDLDGEVSFGDLNTQTIKEIWESPEMEHYRFLNDAGRRSELTLCQNCTTG